MRASSRLAALLLTASLYSYQPAQADEQSCAALLAQADSDFARNVKSLLTALSASDKIDLPPAAKQTISRKDEKGIKMILLLLLKKSGEVAKKAVNAVELANKVYDFLVTSTGPCDDVGSCAQVKSQQCAVRWIRDTVPTVFTDNLSRDQSCASNLLRQLLTTPQ